MIWIIVIFLETGVRKVVKYVPPSLPEEEHDKEGDGRVDSSDKHISDGSSTISFIQQNFVCKHGDVDGVNDEGNAQQEAEKEESYASVEVVPKDVIIQLPATPPDEHVARPDEELDHEEVDYHPEPQRLVDNWLPHHLCKIIFDKFS